MKKYDQFASFLARQSISAHQRSRILRHLSRRGIQILSSLYSAISSDYIRRQSLEQKHELVDTYPYPYREPWFADWEEDSSLGHYTLMSDPQGFVVKHSTSYCAWKFYESYGIKLRRPPSLKSCDAKYWRKLLYDNGFCRTVSRPEPGKSFIGVAMDRGDHGEVVWFEGFDGGQDGLEYEMDNGGNIVYSTYRDKEYKIGAALAEWYIWIQVDRRSTYQHETLI